MRTSPLHPLVLPTPFDTCIYCERDDEVLSALVERARRIADERGLAGVDIVPIPGDVNDTSARAAAAVPSYSRD